MTRNLKERASCFRDGVTSLVVLVLVLGFYYALCRFPLCLIYLNEMTRQWESPGGLGLEPQE